MRKIIVLSFLSFLCIIFFSGCSLFKKEVEPSIILNKNNYEIVVGDSVEIDIDVEGIDEYLLQYSIEDENLISIQNNNITGIKVGQTKVVVRINGYSDTRSSFTVVVVENSEKVKELPIGVILPLTDYSSELGYKVKNGIDLAVNEINETNPIEIDGFIYKIKVIEYYDDKFNPSNSVLGYESLAKQGVKVIVGPFSGSITSSISMLVSNYNIPVIAYDSNNYLYEGIFSLANNINAQTTLLANSSLISRDNKIYIMYNTDYDVCVKAQELFVNISQNNGYSTFSRNYSSSTNDFRSFWNNIIVNNYDCVFINDFCENAAKIIKSGEEAGYNGIFIGTSMINSFEYYEDISFDTLSRCYFTADYYENLLNENIYKFYHSYFDLYNLFPDYLSAYGYEAIYMIKQAAQNNNVISAKGFLDSFNNNVFNNYSLGLDDYEFNNYKLNRIPYLLSFNEDGTIKKVN